MFASGSSTCCIITGASRGLGCCIAVSIAEVAQAQNCEVTFILVARNKEGLEKTLNQVRQVKSSIKGFLIVGDLGKLDTLQGLLDDIFQCVTPSAFSHSLLVNNAGSLGDLSRPMKDFTDPDEVQQYMGLNLTSPFIIASRFVNEFKSTKRYIANISSLMAIQAWKGFSLYCVGKASRDMAHSVLATEEDDVRILNYAPGPLDTDMNNIIQEWSYNQEVKQMLNKGNVLRPKQSSDKLVQILLDDTYKSGAHLDYFDY
ncbi:predicted protein [Nematostella vectensis]|uniref:Sepiapterin reductase n=1 Tax=Nematostella vectensis TaxID=45351 RepID=A7RQ68_NEMVE|nr:sepiapterin reductase [Nematostella vectensis]XP_032219089.1 sepiapterin reductase [Nematostella vectensis]EDO46442.1 predicted protein [Nematostella vectensis]|eukprot:XP_001638505.1 predicted protein [Nematostella vectensis]